MSAFASPAAYVTNSALFPHSSRYGYRTTPEDDAKIIAFPKATGRTRLALSGLLKALGQYSVDNRTCGTLFTSEIEKVLATFGVTSRKSCYNWRKRLVAAEVLAWEGDGYRLRDYAKANRTKEEWLAHDAARRARRALAQNARRKRARQCHKQPQPYATGVKDVHTMGNHLPIGKDRLPDTPIVGHISGGEAQQLHRLHSDLSEPKPLPKARHSSTAANSSKSSQLKLARSPLRGSLAREAAERHPPSGRMESMASLMSGLGFGGASTTASSAPLAPKQARPTQPSPLGKGLGSDKSEKEKGIEGISFMERARRVVERRRLADLEEAKSKAAEQASP